MPTRLTVRLDFDAGRRLGAGKIALLEAIEKTGSISAAGRVHAMSYRRAWLLVDQLNQSFAAPLVAAHHGGAKGGGASLTEEGRRIVPFIATPKPRCARPPKPKSTRSNGGSPRPTRP